MTTPTVPVKPAITLLAVFIATCGGSASSAQPVVRTVASGEVDEGRDVDAGQLFTYGNALAYLPAGVAEYEGPSSSCPASGTRPPVSTWTRGRS